MALENAAIFLSLQPRFAELILNGTKTVELRRMAPSAKAGDLILLYASSPISGLVGTCLVEDIQVDAKALVWDRHGKQSGVSQTEYENYFEGAHQAVAILVKAPRRLPEPRSLARLRNTITGFHPPQSFRYFDQATVEKIGLWQPEGCSHHS